MEGRSEAVRLEATHNDDEDLLNRYLHGDDDAFELLYRRHFSRLCRLASRICGAADGPDAAQAAMVKLAGTDYDRDRGASVRSWIERITVNAAIDQLRRRQRLREVQVADDPEHGVTWDLISEQMGHSEDRHDAWLAHPTFEQHVKEASGEVSDACRQAFLLRECEGLSGEQIADALQASRNAAYMRIHHGKSQFRAAMERRGYYEMPAGHKLPLGARIALVPSKETKQTCAKGGYIPTIMIYDPARGENAPARSPEDE